MKNWQMLEWIWADNYHIINKYHELEFMNLFWIESLGFTMGKINPHKLVSL